MPQSNTRALYLHSSCLLLVSAMLLLFSVVANAQIHQFPQGEFPLTDYKRSSVELDEILTGGPPRDGIPSIDDPQFVTVEAAADWLSDREPVILLTVSGLSRVYPLQIMMYHEIVNDLIGDRPVAVTFCPLCNASIVFDRRLADGAAHKVLDFGTTGRLRNSDLVMYDRQSESWWQQFTGTGIIGTYTDTKLQQLPSHITSFAEVRQYFPDAEVLSAETGFQRPYGNNPYRGYDAIDSNPFLYQGELDPRLPAMERVLSIRRENGTRLVPVTPLLEQPVVNLTIEQDAVVVLAAATAASALDAERIAESRSIPAAAAFKATVDNQPLTFSYRDGVIMDEQSGSEWNGFGLSISGTHKGVQLQQVDSGVHFAFAWLAFDPDAEVLAVE